MLFLKDIKYKCILCKNCDNSQEQVINDCTKTEILRTKLKNEFKDLDNTNKNNKYQIK